MYLTIDDSPTDSTADILKVLEQHNIKATFFLCGPYHSEKRYKPIVEGGHVLANHTKSHDFDLYEESFTVFYKDVRAQDKVIEKFTEKSAVKIFRFPGGSNGHSAFAKKMRNKGYHVFDWTSTFGDTSSKATPQSCLANVKKYTTEDREIILMHNKKHSAKALPDVIKYLLSEGYTFAPITMDTKPYAFA